LTNEAKGMKRVTATLEISSLMGATPAVASVTEMIFKILNLSLFIIIHEKVSSAKFLLGKTFIAFI
jgi:hypothetical protein